MIGGPWNGCQLLTGVACEQTALQMTLGYPQYLTVWSRLLDFTRTPAELFS